MRPTSPDRDDIDMHGLRRSGGTPQVPTVLQFGSEACAHCPAATTLLSQLTADYNFSWVYQDCLSVLADEFQIARLPAIVVWSGDHTDVAIYQGLRGDQVREVVAKHCARRLVLDADF
jgi:thioredoxin-like negative regulator of GroEL